MPCCWFQQQPLPIIMPQVLHSNLFPFAGLLPQYGKQHVHWHTGRPQRRFHCRSSAAKSMIRSRTPISNAYVLCKHKKPNDAMRSEKHPGAVLRRLKYWALMKHRALMSMLSCAHQKSSAHCGMSAAPTHHELDTYCAICLQASALASDNVESCHARGAEDQCQAQNTALTASDLCVPCRVCCLCRYHLLCILLVVSAARAAVASEARCTKPDAHRQPNSLGGRD